MPTLEITETVVSVSEVLYPVELGQVVAVSVDGQISLPYSGNDEPGTGDNILPDGYFRIWKRISDGKVFNVSRMGTEYFFVELG